MVMANRGGDHGGGDRRRFLVPQKKVWRQVIRKEDNNTTNTDHQVQQAIAMDDIITVPNDIVVEILLRLPAKTLLRLQWTCKYWFDLITRDSTFAKMHLHHSSTTTHDNDIFGIISPSILSTSCQGSDHDKIFQCYLNYNYTTREVDVSSEVSIALPFNPSLECRPEIVGSCNGLILLGRRLRLGDNLCIWNPCTREYKILPHSLRNKHAWTEAYNYAFGYDHTTDDYKVIRNAYYKLVSSDDGELYSDVQVCTLGTNSWRRIVSNPYRLGTHWFKHGVFVNGAIYWMDYLEENIISFDCRIEKFRHVSQIPNPIADHHLFKMIHVFEGSVCVVLKVVDEKNYSEIWVMKDYAVNNYESLWTRLSRVPNSLFPMWPLKYTRNGEILMVVGLTGLVLYDQNNNTKTLLCSICKNSTQSVEVFFTESLVSLNSRTDEGEEQRKNTTNDNKNKTK